MIKIEKQHTFFSKALQLIIDMTNDRLIIKVGHMRFCMPPLLFTSSHKLLLQNTYMSYSQDAVPYDVR